MVRHSPRTAGELVDLLGRVLNFIELAHQCHDVCYQHSFGSCYRSSVTSPWKVAEET